MKLKLFVPLALGFTALFLYACKNDLKVLAPYKESISVYGLLNPNEAVQQIRINKVYLGEGDATVMAMNADSVNYGANELTVTLERYMAGSNTPTTTTQSNATKKSIVLTETVVTTASGTFNNTQRLYITTDKLYTTGNYKLIIKNTHSGKEYTSLTSMIDSVKPGTSKPINFGPTQPAHPFPNNFPAGPPAPGAYIDYSNQGVTQKIKFKSVANARLYSVVIRFHYRDSLNTGTVNNMYADYTFPILKSQTLAGNEDLEVDFLSDDFFINIATVINAAPPVTNLSNRASDYIEYFVYSGSQDLSDFLQVNAPSTTIAQNKPYYTNISNDGVGIFACRSRFSIGKDLYSGFVDYIAVNHYTCPLRFCNSTGSASNACQ